MSAEDLQSNRSADAVRDRFLNSLKQYASDDDDDQVTSAMVRGRQMAQEQQPSTTSASQPFIFDAASHSVGNIVAPADPQQIGRQLLHRMHDYSAPPAPSAAPLKRRRGGGNDSSATSGSSFAVVRSYVPLSTGGFIEGGGDDAMDGQVPRVGDILALRGTPSLSRCAQETKSGSAPMPSALSTSPASSADVLKRFRSESDMTPEEKLHGKRLSSEMVDLLFEVVRIDTRGRTVEGLFLNQTRAKLPFSGIRPAGYVERRLYHQWKQDPSSRPLMVIEASAEAAPVSARTATTLVGAVEPGGGATGSNEAARVTPWWVVPRLLVRIAATASGAWYGKKCVVQSIKRAENKIRVCEWSGGGPIGEPVDVVGVEGLETVVPKKGGRAMIVVGERRGDMVLVCGRLRSADGELTSVEVEVGQAKEKLVLKPHELCELSR